MKSRLTFVIVAALTLALTVVSAGVGQVVDSDARAAIKAIEARLDAAGVPKLPTSQPMPPATRPTPAPPIDEPPATRPTVPSVKRALAVPVSGDAARLATKGAKLDGVKITGGSAPKSNNGSAIRIAAENVVVSNVDIVGSVGQYLIMADVGSKNVLLDNVTINGASDWQSHCRTLDAATTITLKDCRFVDTSTKDKAILRGPGSWTIDGGFFAGAAIGPGNPLGKGDGGQEFLITMVQLGVRLDKNYTYLYHVKNDVETRTTVMAAAKRTSDPMELAKIFRSVAVLWTDDTRTRSVACKDVCPDAQLQFNINLRAKSIADRGNVVAKNGATFGRGLSLEAGNAWTTDGTVRMETSGPAIAGYILRYPEDGWGLPYDRPRDAPVWTGNGDVINAAKGWGVPDDVARKILRGWFILNGQRVDFGPVGMFIGPATEQAVAA